MRDQIYLCERSSLLGRLEARRTYLGPTPQGPGAPPPPLSYEISRGTALIHVEGYLSDRGPDLLDTLLGLTGTSYHQILEVLAQAEQDAGVEAISLLVDSPGGEVGVVDEVWQALRSCLKPTCATNQGMMASAAYYLASACSRISARNITAMTGSIGVVILPSSYGEEIVVSAHAAAKDPTSEEGLRALQEEADALERIFCARVAQGRRHTLTHIRETYGRGGLLVADDPERRSPTALSVGMIDDVVSHIDSMRRRTEMDLDELLADHPEVMPLYEARLEAVRQEALAGESQRLEEQRAALQERERACLEREERRGSPYASLIRQVRPYLETESYPREVRTLALRVLAGETSYEVLRESVCLLDQYREAHASEMAREEQPQDTATGAVDDQRSDLSALIGRERRQA